MVNVTVHCPVSHADFVRVTDFEGTTTHIVCPEYDAGSHSCRLKTRAARGGPLGTLLERAQERTLATHGVRCDFI